MNPPENICDDNFLEGFIILRKGSKNYFNSDTLAKTKKKTSLNSIKSAIIYFKPGSQNLDLIIEHELGHAFGYSHVEIEGHVMHPRFEKMGYDFWIP